LKKREAAVAAKKKAEAKAKAAAGRKRQTKTSSPVGSASRLKQKGPIQEEQ
jgi:hypothetical protein